VSYFDFVVPIKLRDRSQTTEKYPTQPVNSAEKKDRPWTAIPVVNPRHPIETPVAAQPNGADDKRAIGQSRPSSAAQKHVVSVSPVPDISVVVPSAVTPYVPSTLEVLQHCDEPPPHEAFDHVHVDRQDGDIDVPEDVKSGETTQVAS
jgi:hypothetical protein